MTVVVKGDKSAGAVFSEGPDPTHRYSLWRRWDESKPVMLWVMLNPSTADHDKTDPTITRCRGYCDTWGMGTMLVGNLYAYRATDPKVMLGQGYDVDIVGAENDQWLLRMAERADWVMCGWGANAKPQRVRSFVEVMGAAEQPLFCLGRTQGDQPRHPLYLRRDAEPEVWWTR